MKKIYFYILFIAASLTQISAQNEPDLFDEAMGAFNSGEFVKAHRIFEEFFETYNTLDELYSTGKFYSAEALLNLNKKDAAATEYEFLVNSFKWSNFRDKALYKLGLIYYENEQYELSRARLNTLLNDHPQSEHTGAALYWVGESYTEENKLEEAIRFLEEAVQKRKNNKYIDYSIFTLASIYEKIGDYESAVKYYDQLLSYHKDSPLAPAAQTRIGAAYFKLKDYQSSILELNSPTLTDLPREQYAESLYLLANSYYRVHEYANAEKTYKEIIQNFPSSPVDREVKYGLGWAYFQQKKFTDAYNVFNTLSGSSDSIGIKSFYWKGEAKRYGGKESEAFAIFKEFLAKYPDSELSDGVRYQLGVLNFNNKKYDVSEDYLEASINSGDRGVRARALTLLGEVELNRRQYNKARSHFENAIKISSIPDDLQNRAQLGLGASLYFLERYNEAIPHLTDVEIRDAAFETDKVNFYLAESYFASGQYKESLKRYLMVDPANKEVGGYSVYGKGYSYLNLRDYENAALAFNEFLKRFPKDKRSIDARLRLADSYYGSKNFAAATKIYENLFKADRSMLNNAYAQYQYAQALYKAGKAEEALSEFTQLQQRFPSSEYADKSMYLIGWINFQRDNYGTAIAQYKNFLTVYPRSELVPVIYYSIGDAYFNQAKYDSAITNYQRVLEVYPNSNYVYDALNGIQYSYVAQGAPERAISLIDEYTMRNPGAAYADQIFFKKGEIYYSQREYESAKTAYKEFIANYPKSKLIAEAYYWIGKSAQNLGQSEEAIYNYERIFNSYPNSESATAAVIEMGNVYVHNKDYDRAVSVIDRALSQMKQSPRFAELIFLKGRALLDKGDFPAAYEAFDEVVQYYPGTIFADKAKLEIGLIELAAKRYSNADIYFKNLADTRTDDIGAKAQYYYGLSLFEQKKYNEAITAFVRVRTIFSSYEEWLVRSYLKMGDSYVELKEFDKAKEMFRAVVQKNKGDVFADEARNKLRTLK